jgi:hypothetical protein
MTIFIREKNGKHYLVNRFKEGGKWREKWIPLQGDDLDNLMKALKIKEEIAKQIVEVPCANPYCSNTIKLTPQQKQDFLISFKKKYDKLVLVCCSKECQQKVLELMQQN